MLFNITCTGPGSPPSGSANVGINIVPSGINGDINNWPNGDGRVNNLDTAAFANYWAARDLKADFDGNGSYGTGDIVRFTIYWVAANGSGAGLDLNELGSR
jgi:hypothetical protein